MRDPEKTVKKEKVPATGLVVSVQGPVVDVKFGREEDVPDIYDVMRAGTFDGRTIVLEVAEHLEGNIARSISLGSTLNLQYNAVVTPAGSSVRVPVGKELFGRIVNVCGEPIDGKGDLKSASSAPIRRNVSREVLDPDMIPEDAARPIETGIKIIDLLFPLVKGGKAGILGGAALGKSILMLELINNIVSGHKGACVFTGAGERIREGNELYFEFEKQKILDRVMMAFGQMNEPPGARFEIALTGVTMAEALQEANEDVLFFIDNVYRFVQAGAEISTLLGRVPSETGYQATLASEVSDFQERIRSRPSGSITAIEAVYVPADDMTDPAVVTIFSYLDSILVLSRERIQLGLYPAIDPVNSICSNLEAAVVGREHFDISQEALKLLAKYEDLRRIVTVIGAGELSKADRTAFERARKLQNFLTQPFFTAEAYTGRKGVYIPVGDTLDGCRKIIEGACDDIPEEKFYMIGRIAEA